MKVTVRGLADLREEADRLQREIESKIVPRVLARTARGARTEISKQVRQRYSVKSGAVNAAVKIGPVRSSQVILTVSGKPLQLSQFGGMRQRKTGVGVTIIKGRRQTLEGAFVVRGRAFTRVGSARLPIRPLAGPAVSQMLLVGDVWRRVQYGIVVRYEKELNRQVARM